MEKKSITTSNYLFEENRKNNALYVDKTEYFYRLVTDSEKCFFCSRPRRFGKSLALSIFNAIFSGRKDLFEGLYISKQDYDWETYPIIHIDFANTDVSSAEIVYENLHNMMMKIAKAYGVEFSGAGIGGEFSGLIDALKEKTGKNVVILIDEYDKPLTENMNDAEEVEKVRRVLDAFYQILKGQNGNERFVFMTGVTKFSKISIFSKLNNLVDITMHRDYACMFGYTQKELEENFAPYIDDYILEKENAGQSVDRDAFIAKIKQWYNGFRFDYEAETVYNPVSVGQFFYNGCRFSNYWFSTGTPTLLVNLAKKQQLTLDDIRDASVSEISFNAFDIADFANGNASKEKLIQLLLQTGYLTFSSMEDYNDVKYFNLTYPNFEVKLAFEIMLLNIYTSGSEENTYLTARKVIRAVSSGDTSRIVDLINNMLSQIPYGIQLKDEKYYQSLMYLFFRMCGMNISAESETSIGRIDAVMEAESHLYIFELKLNKTAEKAVEQITNKKYFQPFIEKARDKNLTIHCVGMNFCTDNDVREINDFNEMPLENILA